MIQSHHNFIKRILSSGGVLAYQEGKGLYEVFSDELVAFFMLVDQINPILGLNEV